MPLPLHMIYIIIKTGFLGFGRKSLVSAEAATRLHLSYISEPRQVGLLTETGFSLDQSVQIARQMMMAVVVVVVVIITARGAGGVRERVGGVGRNIELQS